MSSCTFLHIENLSSTPIYQSVQQQSFNLLMMINTLFTQTETTKLILFIALDVYILPRLLAYPSDQCFTSSNLNRHLGVFGKPVEGQLTRLKMGYPESRDFDFA